MKNLKEYNKFLERNPCLVDYSTAEKFLLIEGLYEIAKQMGHFQSPNLDGLQRKIDLLKKLKRVC